MNDPPEELLGEKIQKAESRIVSNPYDLEAWSLLIREAQLKKIEDARSFYDNLVSQFPTCGRFWKIYIEHELKSKCYEKVEKLFQKCLLKVVHVDLWKLYLNYIKETKINQANYRDKMAQAYDYALDKIGLDFNSQSIWVDYVLFLKSVEAVGSYAENQRIAAVRKIYHKGIVNPMNNIESFWKDYCLFETSINPLIAKKMQEDRSKDYTNARRVAKELETVTKGINKNLPSLPPKNSSEEFKQIEHWKKYIQWEKMNPLRAEEPTVVFKRVMFSYDQCLLFLSHHADIWVEAANYLEESSKQMAEKGNGSMSKILLDEISLLYEKCLLVGPPNNLIIYFSFADFEERRMRYDKVHQIYKKSLESSDLEPTLAYIQYMRFARRSEGIKSARQIFRIGREDKRIKYHIYIYASLIEHFNNKEPDISLKILNLALNKFQNQTSLISEFVDYILRLNEDNNIRILFEKILSSQLPHEKSLEIWNKYMDLETNLGDLNSILKLEKRKKKIFNNEYENKDSNIIIERYKFLDLLPCSYQELKAMGVKDITKSTLTTTTTTTTTTIYPSNAPDNQTTTNNDLLEMEIQADIFDDGLSKSSNKIMMPDTNQMIPFKPKITPLDNSHPVPGGVFPPPPAVADLLLKIPPPYCFNGPFVIVDKFMEHFINLKMPEEYTPGEPYTLNMKIDPGTQFSIEASINRKRKYLDSASNDDVSDEELNSHNPPMFDIYRMRQQRKVR